MIRVCEVRPHCDTTRRDRVAIVTGGSRGLGRDITLALASQGYAVVVNYARNQGAAETAVDEVLAAQGSAMAVRGDVADELDMERLFSETMEAFGGPDVVVHAAGQTPDSSVAGDGLVTFDALLRTNVRGTFIVDRQAARDLADGGAIVNISRSLEGACAVASAAVAAMTRTLAVELRERDITVNALELGAAPPGTLAVMAGVVVFLVGADGHGVTGQVIHAGDQGPTRVVPGREKHS
jgi:3-oxoacyl-[acyl-carrier protein] reductase